MYLEDFADKVEKALIRYYGEKAEVRSQKVFKNNGVLLYGVCVMKKEINVAPTIYLNDFYERYEEGETFGDIIGEIIGLMEKYQVTRSINIDFFEDYSRMKKNLVLRLIHFEENAELLKDVPHRRFMDLAVVCHCIVESKEIGCGAILIRREHMKSWDIDEETMFDDAYENSPVKEPYQFVNMADMLKQLLEEEIENRYLPMYVLTNEKRYYGAACILYPNVLEKIGKVLQEDFYVIPSSVHECIIIRESESMDSAAINRTIRSVNENHVGQEEWLSDHTYFYKRDRKKLFSVTKY